MSASKPMEKNTQLEEAALVAAEIRGRFDPGERIVFVSGNFNVVHPGHLRLLDFAEGCGDRLVVGVNPDNLGDALLREDLRLEGMRSISMVDESFILPVPPEVFVRLLKPEVVVKGKEHEDLPNPEAEIVEHYGGKLLFGSGEVRFSSLDILQRELRETNLSTVLKPLDFPERHNFGLADLVNLVERFSSLKVVVIGDLIVDEYINCDPLGMSREDPTLVVTPIQQDRFIGGASIVAAHASALGAEVEFFCVSGGDGLTAYVDQQLSEYNVSAHLFADDSRPTTLKQRFRADGKTLLRVSHLRQHDVSSGIADDIFSTLAAQIDLADLVIFSDFNYGCLPQPLVERIVALCNERGVMMVADSQTSSQMGDVSRFRGMDLLTPTEHEARIAVGDHSSGLVVLAEQLRVKAQSGPILVTLGAEGLLVHTTTGLHQEVQTDRLPAMNSLPKDVAGAGDCLLLTTMKISRSDIT
ncbi:MAG: PfkB family carbohydrate kinase, partial [Pseudomonadota bacterium]